MGLIKINNINTEVDFRDTSAKNDDSVPKSNHATKGSAPLVFLHEGLGSVQMWSSRDGSWPEKLGALTKRSTLVYSRQGYGQSQALSDYRGANRYRADYMHREAWEFLPALLAHFNMTEPVLVGHSDGGTIALLYASRFRVSACIVIAPHIRVEPMSVQAIEAAKRQFEFGSLRSKLQRYHDDVDCAFWRWNDIWLSEEFNSFDISSQCARIQSPILAIQGSKDPYASVAQINEIYPASGDIERIVLDGCGHSPHKEMPEVTTELIAQYVKNRA